MPLCETKVERHSRPSRVEVPQSRSHTVVIFRKVIKSGLMAGNKDLQIFSKIDVVIKCMGRSVPALFAKL